MIKVITLLIFVLFERNDVTEFTGKETFVPNETSFTQSLQTKEGSFTCAIVEGSLKFTIENYGKRISLEIGNVSLP